MAGHRAGHLLPQVLTERAGSLAARAGKAFNDSEYWRTDHWAAAAG